MLISSSCSREGGGVCLQSGEGRVGSFGWLKVSNACDEKRLAISTVATWPGCLPTLAPSLQTRLHPSLPW